MGTGERCGPAANGLHGARGGKLELRPGDVLVCEGGEIGRPAVWNDDLPGCRYQKAVHGLRPKNDDVDPWFFAYFMLDAFKLSKSLREAATTTTIAHLPAIKLRALPMPLPPLSEQACIVATIGAVDRVADASQRHAG